MFNRIHYFGNVFILLTFIYVTKLVLSEMFEDESSEVDEWLEQNDLGEYKKIFKDLGISTLSGCGSPENMERLPELPAAEERRLRRAAHVLQQRLVLRQWLATHKLQHAYSKLLSLDVSSLEDVYWLEDSTARHVIEPKDFNAWSAARQSLPTGKDALQSLKSDLWSAVVKSSKHQDAWTWGGMLVVSISVCGLVTLAAMTQPSLAPEAKHSLLQYVTGKYLHPPSCKVEWGWEEPQAVGDTMCFTVHCYQRNGQPYPICDTDELVVHIAHGTRKIAAVVELGSGDPAIANTARVKFTVRTAGVYIINILIGGQAGAGGPHRKWFSAGRVEARRSRVGRARAPLVCTAQRARRLHVHPRDRYDNPAPLAHPATQGFSVELAPLGGIPEPELSAAATFEYDAVNRRVSLALCFPRAGVFRAAVHYEGALLHNGEFDCIVLTASDTATVQRQLGSRRGATWEARAVGAGAPGGRPRRVLCVLSAKQLLLKDYFLRFIPKRITSFRLCPSTKLILSPRPEGSGPGGELTLDDGVQPALTLYCAQRDLLAATFTQLLIANCGGEDSFKNKQDYFYSEVRKAHARLPHDKLPLRVARADLLRSSLKATKHYALADWCKNFDVTFQGEQGVDWGGVRREWFSLLCGRLFDARCGLFVSCQDSPAGLVHPNPERPPHLKLKHFEFAGRMVGKCLYESALGGAYRQLVRARLARSFLAQIIGLRVHYKYFEQDDPELYLSKIKYILETDLDASDSLPEIYFADDVYDAAGRFVETRDLVPNGSTIRQTAVPRRAGAVAAGGALAAGDGRLPPRAHSARAGPPARYLRRERTGAADVRHGGGVRGGLARPRAGVGVGARVGAAAGLAVGGRQQLQRRGARAPAAVHDGLLAAAAGRLPRAEPALPDRGGAHARRAAHRAHLLQPAVPARLRLLRAPRARAAVGHQRGRGGFRHDLSRDRRSMTTLNQTIVTCRMCCFSMRVLKLPGEGNDALNVLTISA